MGEPEQTDQPNLYRDPAKSLVLLGAGASKEAGLPLTHEMTELIVERVNEDHRMRYWGASEVLNFVCASLMQYDAARGANPYEGLDVERVFSAVQMLWQRDDLEISPFVLSWHPAIDRRSSPKLPTFFGKDFKEAVLSTRGFGDQDVERRFREGVEGLLGTVDNSVYAHLMGSLTQHLRHILEIPDPSKVSYLEPLLSWVKSAESPAIATLNYDRSIETAAATCGAPVDTGISSLAATGRWSIDKGSIGLIKLHGSIDWELQETRDRSYPMTSERLTFRDDWADTDFEPAIIFGRRGKLRVQGPYLELLRAFEDRLAVTEELIIIGYSFRDDHINEYIRRWINQDPGTRLTVVDPGFDESIEFGSFRWELKTRLSDLGDRFVRYPLPASEALAQFLDVDS